MSITEAAASVAARAFFYPSLAWNIARSRLQDTWHWWDEITENVVLGAIPFYSTLEEFKKLEVKAVVTLNEGFEVFITTEQYQESGIAHLHIPTVDFLYAPPTCDLHKGVDFIHGHASEGRKTYVHCKAGRGRSTTLVVCYLIKYYGQTPEEAYTFVRERRPQVCLAQGQWTAVCGFYISCRPEKGLSIGDFPYPTLLPLAPGKQGSDGCLPEASSVIQAGALEGVTGAEPQAVQQLGKVGPESRNGHRSATDDQPSTAINEETDYHAGLQGTSTGVHVPPSVDLPSATSAASCSQPDTCHSGEGSGQFVRISASTQAADSDDVVLLSSLGSTATSGSDLSLSKLATALGSCCIHPRPDRGKGHAEQSVFLSSTGFQPPQRAASPAIEIPRGRSPEPKPLGTMTATPSSKGSITLEPSGSLPGYIRIAPAELARISSGEVPPFKATISSTGFTPIEDWADVSGTQGEQ